LRNKQRKAKKKAELENAQAVNAEKKKEQYNKSRQQQNQDGDPEAPVLAELIPEKLARPEDPLGKAIEFLKPLQLLTSGLIETHLMTFEIYYRKNKLLIMLQALKRAYAIDPNNATLHGCIVRFIKLTDKSLAGANEFVRTVIQREIETKLPIIGKRSVDVNDDFIAKNKDSAEAYIAAARIYYDDTPNNKTKAIELLMSCTQLKSFTLPVSLAIHILFKRLLIV
jgi:peptide alpha-N-acetyltransferase